MVATVRIGTGIPERSTVAAQFNLSFRKRYEERLYVQKPNTWKSRGKSNIIQSNDRLEFDPPSIPTRVQEEESLATVLNQWRRNSRKSSSLGDFEITLFNLLSL